MNNIELVATIMRRMGISPALENEATLPLEYWEAQGETAATLHESMVADMLESIHEKTQFLERKENGQYYAKAELIVFNPVEFSTFISLVCDAMIERGKMLALPQRMGIIT